MARNRMLNPEFWLDEEIAKLSPRARLLYMGLWGICDDNYATLPNMPGWIKAQIFPYEKIDIEKLLKELQEVGKIIIFKFEDKEYWFLKNFFKYQHVERPSKAKYPEFKADCQVLGEYSVSTLAEEKRREEKRKGHPLFERFWEEYPNKVKKQVALKAFTNLNPDGELFKKMIVSLEAQKQSKQWKEENGKFIPHPTTWLNQRRWEDELKVVKQDWQSN